MDLVREVASRVELETVSCREFHAVLLADQVEPKAALNVEVSYQAGTRTPDPKIVDVRVHARLRGLPPGESGAVVFEVLATFDLRYSVSEGAPLSEGAVDAFANLNGVYNAWPYLREAFQAATTRLGLPPFVLKLFKVQPTKQKKGKKGPARRGS